jgi:hypothetical protein
MSSGDRDGIPPAKIARFTKLLTIGAESVARKQKATKMKDVVYTAALVSLLWCFDGSWVLTTFEGAGPQKKQ